MHVDNAAELTVPNATTTEVERGEIALYEVLEICLIHDGQGLQTHIWLGLAEVIEALPAVGDGILEDLAPV
ncbi:MAG TPA: hypothetical protein VE844_15095, partial [Gammaproteobacteria bacterium]|nr:hypothetical protein [Gammaproteobacteria bacterium]